VAWKVYRKVTYPDFPVTVAIMGPNRFMIAVWRATGSGLGSTTVGTSGVVGGEKDMIGK